MTAAHFHLLIVHVPIVLCPLALVVLMVDGRRESPPSVFGYVLLMVAGLLGGLAYYSGPSAYEQLQTTLAADKEWVEQHAVIGKAAFVVLILVSVLALQIVLRILQEEPVSKGLRLSVLVGALLAAYVLAWAAHLGGQIRHVEIRESEWMIFPHLPG